MSASTCAFCLLRLHNSVNIAVIMYDIAVKCVCLGECADSVHDAAVLFGPPGGSVESPPTTLTYYLLRQLLC